MHAIELRTRSTDIFWQRSDEPKKEKERKIRVKEREREKKKNARSGMSGWTNSIVVGRLTTIGQRDIFSYRV